MSAFLLNCPQTLESISRLRSLVRTSMGPNGRLKMLSNGCGGRIQLTSSSARLLPATRLSDPVLRVVAQAATHHLRCHGNDGLYLMAVVLELMDRSLRLSDAVPQCRMARLVQLLGRAASDHLCRLKIRVGFDSLRIPLLLARSVLSSKPGCALSDDERDHLAVLLTKAFLDGVPALDGSNIFATLHYVSQHNQSPRQSVLHRGVLMPAESDGGRITMPEVARSYSCALFRVSLSGDVGTELTDDAATTFRLSDEVDVVGSCVGRIMELCDQLLEAEVDVVACQKVIHPLVRGRLQDHGVVVLDRLGLIAFEAFLELTDCCAIESFVATVDKSNFGSLTKISTLTIGKTTHYLMQAETSLVSTLVLCNYLEESLEELKVVCRQTMDALRNLVQFSYVFPGGGCLESHMAAYIRHWGFQNQTELLKVGGNVGDVSLAVANFAKCLERVAQTPANTSAPLFTDDVAHHLWSSAEGDARCRCGLISKSHLRMKDARMHVLSAGPALPVSWDSVATWCETEIGDAELDSLTVVDGAASKLEAFKTATETVVTLLSVDVIIKK